MAKKNLGKDNHKKDNKTNIKAGIINSAKISNKIRSSIPLKIRHIDGWDISEYSDVKVTSPILIEGMPGIGNVGKVTMDILIEDLGADLLMSFYSKNLPNSVFVNEDNLIDLPLIGLYHKRINGQDFLFLTGDVQPVNEHASYSFCEVIMQIFKDYNGTHIITLGGIGLNTIPAEPKVYVTGNDRKFVDGIMNDLKKRNIAFESKIYGMVGPIMGISGLLLGISRRHNVNAYCLLSETLGHPVYVGLKGSKALLLALASQYGFNIQFEKLDKEIAQIEERLANPDGDKESRKYGRYSDVNYIG